MGDGRARQPGRAGPPFAGRADQPAVRRANLGLVLRTVRAAPRSQAQVSAATGLTRATVSSLVGELTARGLVRTGAPDRAGAIGRPGSTVECRPGRVLGIGVEVNVDYLAGSVVDLAGHPVTAVRRAVRLAGLPAADAAAAVAGLVRTLVRLARRWRPAVLGGVGIAAPGLVDVAAGVVRLAPNLGWQQVALRAEVRARLRGLDVDVEVDNEANLAALAEHAIGVAAGEPDLLCVTGGIGVGGGMVSGGRPLRGANGFAGEVGHLTVEPGGRPCGCGRRGCWETVCGLRALLAAAADDADPVRDPDRDVAERLELLAARARAGDRRTLRALAAVGDAVGRGSAMLVNVVDPGVVVLGGSFAVLGPFLRDRVEDGLSAGVVAPRARHCRVVVSDLGLSAAAVGAAIATTSTLLADPTRVPRLAGEPAA